ncbi:MAG: PAS domain S-box protein [Desulfohalobiaceae bacterium]
MAQNSHSAQDTGYSALSSEYSLFTNAPLGIIITTPEGRLLSANPAMAKMFGYDSPDELIESVKGNNTQLYADLSDREELIRLLRENDEVLNYECRGIYRDGSIIWTSINVSTVRDTNGKIIHFQGFITDVTESKQLQDRLSRNERFLDAVLESVQDGISIVDPDLTIRRVNEVMRRWYAQNLPLEGKKCYAAYHKAHAPCSPCPTQRSFQSGRMEYEEVPGLPGSSAQWIELFSYPMRNEEGQVDYVTEFVRYISDRKQAEEALRRSENYYRAIFETSGATMLIIEEDTTISHINSNFEKLTGYPRHEVEGKKSWTEFVHQDDLEWLKHYHYLRRQDPDAAPRQYEFRFMTRHGQWRNASFTIDMIPGTNQSIGSGIDITERNQAEEKLLKREEHLQAILQATPDPMVVYNNVGHPQYINPSFTQVFGWTLDELQGQQIPFVPGDQKELTFTKIQEIYSTGVPVNFDTRRLTKNNRLLDIRISAAIIIESSLKEHYGLVVILTDITERKQLEQKLKEMSIYDSLTGLYNRNFFEEEMKRLSDGRHNPLGVIVCDLDGLKFLNDTLGHQAGDRMLVNIAEILRQNFRSSDMIARIGGDEFAILLTDTEPEMVEQILWRVRQAVHEYNNSDPEIPLSLSMGHALGEVELADMQALFREADNRMYREKLQREGSARSSILQALTVSMEARDFNTENHCDRLQELAASLARSLNLSQDLVNDLYLLARFHDLGKVGIPDHILFKPGALKEEEWRQMRQHCEIGHRIASSLPDLEPIAEYILKHHEWLDGQGYPQGLSGDDIPLPCRILAIADAYDAMTSDRPYRNALTQEEAISELRRFAGKQFDPELVEQFIQILEEHNF